MEATAKTYRGYAVQEVDVPTRYFIALREKITMDKMSEGFAKNLPLVFGAVQQAGIEMVGAPSGLYFTWDEAAKMTELAYGIPVKTNTEIPGFETIETPAGKSLVIDYFGSYENLVNAHMAMDDYMKEHGLELIMPVYEEYITDPGMEADPAKWLTKICYPVN